MTTTRSLTDPATAAFAPFVEDAVRAFAHELEADPRLRVAVFGDSFVQGAFSALEDTFAERLEAAQAAKEFVSAGIRQRVSSHAPFDSLWQGGLAAEA